MARVWDRLGKAIAGHMLCLMPCCLALGIFLPQVFRALNPLVSPMFALMAFQGALSNRLSRVRSTFRHPLPLVLTLAFSHLAMPLVAFGVSRILMVGSPVMAGVLLEYCVPIASSSIMWVGMYEGDVALSLSAILISALVCPLTLPLTMQALMGTTVSVDVPSMMGQLLLVVALPTLAGTLVNEGTDGWGKEALAPRLAPLARVFLLLIIVANTTGISDLMLHLTPELLAIIGLMGALCLTGFGLALLLARLTRQPCDRFVSMTFSCGMKNISAGAVICARYLPAASLFPVMAGTLFQQFMAAAFGTLMGRLLADEPSGEAASSPEDLPQGEASPSLGRPPAGLGGRPAPLVR